MLQNDSKDCLKSCSCVTELRSSSGKEDLYVHTHVHTHTHTQMYVIKVTICVAKQKRSYYR
jgi:hypothetical protein